MYLVPGGYLVLGGVPSPRGYLVLGGVYLVPGGVPGPGGGVPGARFIRTDCMRRIQ